MANKVLTSEGWEQRVRDKLSVDVAYLPDSVINQPDFITIAELKIIKSLPEYESLTGDDKVYLEAAIVCECARLLCPGMRSRLPKMEAGPAFKVELDTDWDKMALDLESERDINLGEITTYEVEGTFYGFDLSGRL